MALGSQLRPFPSSTHLTAPCSAQLQRWPFQSSAHLIASSTTQI